DTLRHVNVYPGRGYSALWGYTAPDGREYALLGVNGTSTSAPGGTSFVDITDSANVRQVAFVKGPNSSWREMKTYKNYAYVVTEAGSGTQIIDLSYLPDSVHLIKSFTFVHPDSAAKTTAKSHSISIHDGYMYLNGCATWGTRDQRGMIIFDLRGDPINPRFVGEYSPLYIHDSYVLNDTIYASAVYDNGGLYIADARDKGHITTIGKIVYSGSGTHNSWVTKNHQYVISTDEIGATAKTLKVWDIRNLPTIPSTPVNTFSSSPADIEHNITIRGDYAYVAWYTAGVRVVNITNPASPTDAGGYDTYSGSSGGYNGVWGVYPYFPSGKVIGSDMTSGLWVFRFSSLKPRIPVYLIAPANNDTVVSPAAITFRWNKTANLNSDPHWYEVRLRGTGIDITWRADDSLSVLTNPAVLQNGQTYTWRVTVRDEWNTTASVDSFRFTYKSNPNSVGTTFETPLSFSLEQNYPNPFNPSTKIEFHLSVSGLTTLTVYDMLGRQVSQPVNEVLTAGLHFMNFDAGNLASGTYIYRLRSGPFVETKQMLLIR
ncbi:MAG: choice-of-anchor B family protein, partial [bacterium]